MKKGFTVFDAFTVLAVYLLFENRVSWWVVPLPWLTELIFYIVSVLLTYYGTAKRMEFSLWSFLLNRKITKIKEDVKAKF